MNITHGNNDIQFIFQPNLCCGFGLSGKAVGGYDCLEILGLKKATANMMAAGSRICGAMAGLVSSNAQTAASEAASRTLCSKFQ